MTVGSASVVVPALSLLALSKVEGPKGHPGPGIAFLRLVYFPNPTDYARAHTARKVAMFAFAKSSLTLVAIPCCLAATTKNFLTYPAIGPIFVLQDDLFGCSFRHHILPYRSELSAFRTRCPQAGSLNNEL